MVKQKPADFMDEDLLVYMQVSPKKKLEHLEQMNSFLRKIRPPKSQRISQKLAQEGF